MITLWIRGNMKHIAPILSILFVILSTMGTQEATATNENKEIINLTKTTALYTNVDTKVKNLCPDGMVEIEGDYCPNANEVCLEWVTRKGEATKEAIPGPGDSGRCGTWQSPTTCNSNIKIHKHYCMDKYEYPNIEGHVPQSWMSWYDAKNACESTGKRLCNKHEWTFACEGPNMQPYPYGDGYHRNRTSCNTDNSVPDGVDVMNVSTQKSEDGVKLDGLLNPSGSKPECVSPFGVYDMVGNIDEFVVNESGRPYKSSLVGGHVFGVRNACRPSTDGHNEGFYWYETGTRCCQDIK